MIILENISKEYGERVLFRDLNYQFPLREKIALVGPNGRGKTTLLRIIIGEEEPSKGKVVMRKGLELGYLPQEPNPNPRESVLEEAISGAQKIANLRDQLKILVAKMQEETNTNEDLTHKYGDIEAQFQTLGGYGVEADAVQILHGLGFNDRQIACSPLELSGGWRMRLELAKIFLNNPQFLLLDEPTNHLDLPSLVWVENFLQTYRGTLIFVSHDRPLLNRLSTIILELSTVGVHAYPGSFDNYLNQKELRAAQLQAEREQILRRQKEITDFITRFGAKASKATQAQSRMKMLARLRAEEQGIPVEEAQKSITIRLPEPEKSARMALQVENVTIGYGELRLGTNINLKIERGMKVAIIGANGIGKSTFLKTLNGTITKLAGKITFGERVRCSYFAQDQLDVLDDDKNILENVLHNNPKIGEPVARNLLGSLLFRGPDVFKKVGVLSGGEKSRVGLAKVLLEDSNFLFLDEPTNHLDMASVDILATALSGYQGTLLFVSHDREFIDVVCTHVFVMLADGRSAIFEGKLDDYQRLSAAGNFPDILQPDAEKTKSTNAAPAKKQATPRTAPDKSKSQKKEVEKTEKEMEHLRVELQTVTDALAICEPSDFAQLSTLETQRQTLMEKLSDLEDQWLALNA